MIPSHCYSLAKQNAQIELGILKSFEFISQLRRASVVVGQSGFSGGDIYVKGAPECMVDICRQDSCRSSFAYKIPFKY